MLDDSLQPIMQNEMDENLRLLEAILFTQADPISFTSLSIYFPHLIPDELEQLITQLQMRYQSSGVQLMKFGKAYAFRTAPDLADRLILKREIPKLLTRAAGETLAIIAYHQPVTRAEIEAVRGVNVSRGTLDLLLEAGWIRPLGRKQVPGRPVTWGTSEAFLAHFGLSGLDALPGLDELKAAGLLESRHLQGIAMREDDLEESEDDEMPEGLTPEDLTASLTED